MPGQGDPVDLRVQGGRAVLAGSELFAGTADDLVLAVAGLVGSGGVRTIITPNVDQVLLIPEHAAMGEAYRAAALRIADGAPLVWLGRALGARDLHRLTGADLLIQVARAAPEHGWRVVVTGGASGVAKSAARILSSRYGADVVGMDFPLLDGVDDPAADVVVDRLRALSPDVVFICLGAPKQDVWVHRWRAELPAGVYVGAGAAVDFVAGTRRRAPRIVQVLGGEWLFRLAQEPRRLAKRYLLRGPRFVAVVVRSVLAARGAGR